MKYVNLHVHTRYSDGQLTPKEVVKLASKDPNLSVISISDHDTIAGLREAQRVARTNGIDIIPGIELSIRTEPEKDFFQLHLLGYFFDPQNQQLTDYLERRRISRLERGREYARKLQALGFSIRVEDIDKLGETKSIGKPDIARLVLKNHPDMDEEELFKGYLNYGGKVFVPYDFDVRLEDGIALVRAAGGIAGLAHPGSYYQVADIEGVVERSKDMGADFLEVFYPYPESRMVMIHRFMNMAERFGLGVSGGSDFHSYSSEMWLPKTPYRYFEQLRQIVENRL